MSSALQICQVAMTYQDIMQDEQTRLGRANGNMFQRKPGLPNVHDGQVMVRLKKKRFVVLDYTLTPNAADRDYASHNTHMALYAGAGTQACTTPECTKVGVPIKLFDSHPGETEPLYCRVGLCFECQRNLNESRRVDRKRLRNKAKSATTSTTSTKKQEQSTLFYALAPCPKRFKLSAPPRSNIGDNNVIHLKKDAVILNGAPTVDTKKVADGYGYDEIGTDLQVQARQGCEDTLQLLQAANSSTGNHSAELDHLYERAFVSLNKAIFLLSQWKASWDASHPRGEEDDDGEQEHQDENNATENTMGNSHSLETTSHVTTTTTTTTAINSSVDTLLLAADTQDKQEHELQQLLLQQQQQHYHQHQQHSNSSEDHYPSHHHHHHTSHQQHHYASEEDHNQNSNNDETEEGGTVLRHHPISTSTHPGSTTYHQNQQHHHHPTQPHNLLDDSPFASVVAAAAAAAQHHHLLEEQQQQQQPTQEISPQGRHPGAPPATHATTTTAARPTGEGNDDSGGKREGDNDEAGGDFCM